MLYVEVNRKGERQILGWHAGEPTPMDRDDEIVSVYADGDEYAHIIFTFHNLPMNPRKNHAIWHGDFATFIAWNM